MITQNWYKVGALAVERGRTDGSDLRWMGTVPTGPGLWTGMNPVGVSEAVWKPWVLSAPDELRPGAPPAFDSPEMAAELAELKNFMRTPRTTGIALGWQYGVYGGPINVVYWLRQAGRLIFEDRLDSNAPWVARLYAMLSTGFNDTWIATQDGKFTYWAIRPNQLDPTLTTVFPTPNHPSYPSNRASFNVGAEVLAHFFPREAELLLGIAKEVSESALWAGIHFRSDIVAGNAIGAGVARRLIERISGDE